jgi:acyl dehydratase
MSEAAVTAGSPPEPDASATRWFDELEQGMRWVSRRRTLTEADLTQFAGLSGDYNPIHVDAVAAARGPFGRRLIQGILVLSVTSGLRQQLGVFHDSMKALLEIRGWRFQRPVFIGDTITAITTIESLRPTTKGDAGIVVQRVEVVNQDGETVQSGEFVTLMRTRPQEERR